MPVISLRSRLVAFLEKKLHGKQPPGSLTGSTSLLKSGFLDSLDLLDLAMWIEQHIGPDIDISTVDIAQEWDTVADILQFISTRRPDALDESDAS